MAMNRRNIALSLAGVVLVSAGGFAVVQTVREALAEPAPAVRASMRGMSDPAAAEVRQARRHAARAARRQLLEQGVITEDTPRHEAWQKIREHIAAQAQASMAAPPVEADDTH